MQRKTTAILCAAGGLVAAAVALETHQDAARAANSRPVIGPPPVQVKNQNTCAVGDALPARATADFGTGQMTAALSGSRLLQGAGGEIYMAVDLKVNDKQGDKRAPVNMAIVIDHSGSMAGDKIAQARQAARGIVERLDAGDRVALIQYDDTAQVLVASIAMDGEGKQKMLRAIDGVEDAGGTNLNDGMMLGIDEARKSTGDQRINRVVLLSDGQANVGVVDPQAIAKNAANAADQGIRVTTIGLGLDYNEDLMELVAESGRGNYYYVKDGGGLEKVFAGELHSMQSTVATAAELRLSPACTGVDIEEVYGYQFRRDGHDVIVPLTDLFGGESRKVLIKLRAPAGTIGQKGLARATLGFDDAAGGGRKTAALNLGVEVSGDAQAVRESADKEVLAQVAQVEAARQMRLAAEAYDKGDREGAMRIIGDAKKHTAEKAKEYDLPAAATTGIYDSLDGAGAGMAAAPGSDEAKDASKTIKAGARSMQK
jgi:Ca-activated chloride channel family protein